MSKTKWLFLFASAPLFCTFGQLACSSGEVDLPYEIYPDGGIAVPDDPLQGTDNSQSNTSGAESGSDTTAEADVDFGTGSNPDTAPEADTFSNSNDEADSEVNSDVETGSPDDASTSQPLAGDLNITQIAAYQSTKITLMKNGTAVAAAGRAAQLLAGKEALVRVFVQPAAKYSARPIRAVIEFASGTTVSSDAQTINSGSQDASLKSTFNIYVTGDYLKMNEQFAISLHEVNSSSQGNTEGSRWPTSGYSALSSFDVSGNLSPRGQFKIFLVPIEYRADGSGRVPAITEQFKQRLHDVMLGTYPATEIEITITEPMPTNTTISADGGGWSNALSQVISFRNNHGAARNEFYYGMVNPAQTMAGFCSFGCVAGMSPVGNLNCSASWGGGKGSIGLGFVAGGADYTMAHEIAHALGREHSPCGGPSNVDPSYPVANGNLDAWGWDIVNKKLKAPSEFKDLMTYCSPQWISAHHYRGMAATVAKCNSGSMKIIPPLGGPTKYMTISIGLLGEYHRGPSFELVVPPGGEEERVVELLNADLDIVEEIKGYFISYADTHWGDFVPVVPLSETPGYVFFPIPTSDEVLFARLPGGPAIPIKAPIF